MKSCKFLASGFRNQVSRSSLQGLGFKYFFICAFLFVVLASGCAGVKETAKGIIGVSTKELEKSSNNAIKEVFSCEYQVCYNETMNIIKETGSYIYAIDVPKNMVAVYVSQQDTTAVGLFFKKIGADKTEIKVSSPSAYGKELIAKNIFTRLKKICSSESGKPKR